MELTLNVLWLIIAAAGVVVVKNRPRQVWLAMVFALAILFPIISASDDVNAIGTFTDTVAAFAVVVGFSVALIAIARLGSLPAPVHVFHLETPSDPRSPPAR